VEEESVVRQRPVSGKSVAAIATCHQRDIQGTGRQGCISPSNGALSTTAWGARRWPRHAVSASPASPTSTPRPVALLQRVVGPLQAAHHAATRPPRPPQEESRPPICPHSALTSSGRKASQALPAQAPRYPPHPRLLASNHHTSLIRPAPSCHARPSHRYQSETRAPSRA